MASKDYDPQRKENRKSAMGNVLYTTDTLQDDISSGLLLNISETGACICTQECLGQDDTIKIYSNLLGKEPFEVCVKWCAPIDEELYRIGLSLDS